MVLTLSNVFLLPPQLYYLVLIVYTDHKIGTASRHWECIEYCLWRGWRKFFSKVNLENHKIRMG